MGVGNADTGRGPQIYFTTTNLDYFISQTIPNFLKKISSKSNLQPTLNEVIKTLFYDLGLSGRYKYILNGEKCEIFNKGYMEEIKKKVKKEKKKNVKGCRE